MTLAAAEARRDRDRRAASEVGLNPGEIMAFEVRLGGVLAGEAQLAVGEIGEFDGQRAVVVKSRAETAGAAALIKKIVDEATTTIDIDTGRPLLLDTLVEQGGKTTTATATFVGSVANITYHKSDDPTPHTFKVDFGKVTVHDTHSAMAQIRGWRPDARHDAHGVRRRRPPAVARRRPLHRHRDDRHRRSATAARFTSTARRIARGANFGVESEKPARTFSVWLSDDADRVPLKMVAHTELGDVTMDLTEYNRP